MRSDWRYFRIVALSVGCLVSFPRLCSSAVWFAGQASRAGEDPFQTALLALKEDRLEAALDALTDAERMHPDDPRIRSFRGVVLTRMKRSGEAADEYREAIRLDPSMEDAYRNLGYLQWTEHRLEEARQSLGQALKLKPADGFAHYYLGRIELEARSYGQAFAELNRSGVELPRDPEFLLAAATGYMAIGRPDDARAILKRLDLPTLTPAQSVQAASIFSNLQKADEAMQVLRSLRSPTDESPPWLRFDVALAHLYAGQNEAAIEETASLKNPPALNSRPGGEPLSASAWSLLGIAHARLGHAGPAVDALRHATVLAPLQEEHWLNLTRELMELSRFPDAIAATHEALAANPQSYALHLRLGAADLAGGRYADAEAVFRELVAAGDPLPTSYVGLAQVLLRTDRANDAVSELAAARERLGPNFLISYFQGISLSRVNRREEAATAFRGAIYLNPQSAEAHFGLGKTELALGQVAEAIAQLEEALRLSPGDVPARRLLTQARFRLAKPTASAASIEPPAESATKNPTDRLDDFFLPDWQYP